MNPENSKYHSTISYFIPIKGMVNFCDNVDWRRESNGENFDAIDHDSSRDLLVGAVLLGYNTGVVVVAATTIWQGIENLIR
ncbi:hypothetical protein J4444_03855 [Candidatus Woesearchaeota archaeon]|nr:hypothetical protein [Candidatus Woesearchaeota archaeon]